MLSEVFRFMAVRALRRTSEKDDVIRLDIEPRRLLNRIPGGATGGLDVRDVAREVVDLPDFKRPSKEEARLAELAGDLRRTPGAGPADLGHLVGLSGDAAADLEDNLAARVLIGESGPRVESLADAVRVLRLVQREQAGMAVDAERILRAPILLGGKAGEPIASDDFDDSDILDFRRAHFGPVGVGDLMVVEQRPLRYELGEISHIETALPREGRKRVHRRLSRVEESSFLMTEETTETEEDLQSSERFELQSEAESEIQKDTSLEAGLTVTAKYGPTVEATASMAYASNTSQRESSRRSSDFARDIVSRSAKRVTAKVRAESRRTTLSETEETNTHELDNTGDENPIVGISRYVDKIYEAKLINYGQRLLFEFFIPQPGRWLRTSRKSEIKAEVKEPKPPTVGNRPLTPADIRENDYQRLAATAGVSQMLAPPPLTSHVSKTVHAATDPSVSREYYAESGTIEIPAGYGAKSASIAVALTPGGAMVIRGDDLTWSGDGNAENQAAHARVAVGASEAGQFFRPGAPGSGPTGDTVTLEGQTGSIPFFVTSYHHEILAVTIEVECERQEDALDGWRHEVFAAIHEAYQRQLAEYREARANAQAGRVSEPVTHPLRLRELERQELKKQVVQMLQQSVRFDTSSPLGESSPPGPTLGEDSVLHEGDIVWERLEEVAPYIRFFEQSFEWAQMTYHLYPYYWSEETKWSNLAHLEHPDTLHGQFLRAGAARVIVSVRRGFEGWVHYFLWSQGRLPDSTIAPLLTDETWLPVAVEIAEASGRKPDDRVVVDCWEVRLPTTLVSLDDGRPLPTFPASDDCVHGSEG